MDTNQFSSSITPCPNRFGIEPPFPEVEGVRSAQPGEFIGYRVTTAGDVWSCWRKGGNRWGIGFQNWWRKLKSKTNPDGYQLITMRGDLGQTEHRIHVLVLTTFIGPRPEGMQGCRNDGNPANNVLTNLRWDTQKGNFADMVGHGTRPWGVRNGNSKLSEELVRLIRVRASSGCPQKTIVQELGLKKSTVSLVVRGEIWKHVT